MGLNVNKAITSVETFLGKAARGEGMLGGIGGVASGFRNRGGANGVGTILNEAGEGVGTMINFEKKGFTDIVKDAHRAAADDWDNIGGYSAKKIAGSYMGIAAAGRIATGGGIYRDSDGNGNLIGVPFI